MIAHQLDLFGGPLKPPKKIKVDDDIPAESPIAVQPETITPEPAITAEKHHDEARAELPVGEDADDSHPLFLEEDLVTNEAVWSPESDEEIVYQQQDFLQQETQSKEPKISENATAELSSAFNHHTAPDNQAIFTEALAESETVTDAVYEETNSGKSADAVEEISPGEEIKPAITSNPKNKRITDDEEGLNIPSDEELFKRQYYSMRETSAMFGVNQSLLRFWENEFDILQPKKNKKGDRYFRPVDIKNLVLIYNLLRVRKFTLEGAKDYLNSHKKAADSFELVRKLEKLKSFLLELKAGL